MQEISKSYKKYTSNQIIELGLAKSFRSSADDVQKSTAGFSVDVYDVEEK